MDGYLTRRLAMTPLVLLGVSFILFMLLYVRWPQQEQAVSICDGCVWSEEAERWYEQLRLDEPWYERYGAWLWDALRGNLGDSLLYPWAYPPYEMGRSHLLAPVSLFAVWGLCVLIVLVRGIRNPRLRMGARCGDRASARRLSLLAISAR